MAHCDAGGEAVHRIRSRSTDDPTPMSAVGRKAVMNG